MLHRYYQALRRPAAHAAALGFLRLAVPLVRPTFAPPNPERRTRRPGLLRFGQPAPIRVPTETTGTPKFLGNPGVGLPCSSTPAGPLRLTYSTPRHGPRYQDDEGSHIDCFEAQ